MPRRKVTLDVKVQFMREGLRLSGLEDLLHKYGVSERSAYNWYCEILEALPDTLADDKPGRKPKPPIDSGPPF